MTTATSSCRSASTPEGPAAAWAARRLEVADVRCWRRAELDLPAGLVVVVGPNGAGKTSLIEAVTLGCLGVSPRTAREAEVVRRGAEASTSRARRVPIGGRSGSRPAAGGGSASTASRCGRWPRGGPARCWSSSLTSSGP